MDLFIYRHSVQCCMGVRAIVGENINCAFANNACEGDGERPFYCSQAWVRAAHFLSAVRAHFLLQQRTLQTQYCQCLGFIIHI